MAINNPTIKKIETNKLIQADWNYKKDDEEKTIKLMDSIKFDKSAGVLAVRSLGDKYEVIDGNHRLIAIQKLGWEIVDCEDFGNITMAEAITIARRRNSLWFEDDIIKLSGLLKEVVLPEIPLDILKQIMPEKPEDLDYLVNLSSFDFNKYEENNLTENEEWVTMSFRVSNEQKKVIRQALDRVIQKEGYQNNPDGMALEMICADYLGGA